MACLHGLFLVVFAAAAAVLLSPPGAHGFYLPGSYPHKYNLGETLNVKVNALTSIDTEIPFSYYSLPFYTPPEGVKDSTDNLGELLMGDRIENSPYRFRMYTNESDLFLCRSAPLPPNTFALLKKRIDGMYQVNLILDNLPAICYTKKDDYFLRWTGYPVGIRVGVDYYVFNHLQFTVFVHKYEEANVARVMGTSDATDVIPFGGKDGGAGSSACWMVVGFEVVPCSIKHNPQDVKSLKMYNKYPSKIKCDPTSRGTLITGMLFFYLVLGILVRYVGVRVWKTIKCGDHSGPVPSPSHCLLYCLCSGYAFLVLAHRPLVPFSSSSSSSCQAYGWGVCTMFLDSSSSSCCFWLLSVLRFPWF